MSTRGNCGDMELRLLSDSEMRRNIYKQTFVTDPWANVATSEHEPLTANSLIDVYQNHRNHLKRG